MRYPNPTASRKLEMSSWSTLSASSLVYERRKSSSNRVSSSPVVGSNTAVMALVPVCSPGWKCRSPLASFHVHCSLYEPLALTLFARVLGT